MSRGYEVNAGEFERLPVRISLSGPVAGHFLEGLSNTSSHTRGCSWPSRVSSSTIAIARSSLPERDAGSPVCRNVRFPKSSAQRGT